MQRKIFSKLVIYCCLMLGIVAKNIQAQTDSISIYDLNLSQLSKLKITTLTKSPQPINELPSTINIVTAAQIKENGYLTLEDVLNSLPGFQFRNILGINSYVFLRGVPNQNNLILLLIDGVQVNELNSGGFYGGGQYNLSNVERIEVIYGPSSVAYGSNAISGIINIITKKVNGSIAEASLLGGNFNTYKGDVVFGKSNNLKNKSFIASAMVNSTEKANLKGKAGDNQWTDLMENFEHNYAIDLKGHWKNCIVGTNYMYKEASNTTSIKSIGTAYKDFGTSWNIQFINSYVKYNRQIFDKLTYSTIVYNRNSTVLKNTVFRVLDTAQIGYYRPNNLTGTEHILQYTLSNSLSFTTGGLFEFESLAKTPSYSYSDSCIFKPPIPSKPAMLNNTLAGIFVEPQIVLWKKVFLSGGVRYDKSSSYNEVFTPRAGILYHFNKHTARVVYSEAFRAPRPWDYSNGLGNPDLLPEKLKSHEVALAFHINNNLKLETVGFLNDFNNLITKEVVPEGFRWINTGSIIASGTEISLRYITQKFKAHLNYSYCNSINELKQQIPEISKHTANANFSYTFNNKFQALISGQYVGNRKNPKQIPSIQSDMIKAYTIVNGAINIFDVQGFDIQFLVRNALNCKYFHPSNRDPDWYRQPQRMFLLKISFGIEGK